MNPAILAKLDWNLLLERIASFAQTQHGRQRCLELFPDLNREQIEQRWNVVDPLKQLYRDGYQPPIGELPDLSKVFKASELGQILQGEDFREVLHLLNSINQVKKFCKDFRERCQPLNRVYGQILDHQKLAKAINDAIAPDGKVMDEASKELANIRKSKVNLRKKIESKITEILSDSKIETYLQDRFFTIRSDRYVVPIRLDGRGRVKGSIYDTSSSGQTLYIEPSSIAPMNEQLLELELSEKLEVLRILRQLSAQVAQEVDSLKHSYLELVELDFVCAQACLAQEIQAGTVEIVDSPHLRIVQGRHPLVKTPNGRNAIGNDVELEDTQSVLMISGPNAGGKTVVLKTVAIAQCMLKAGLLIPADKTSRMYLFENLYLEMGDAQSLTANLSTFSGHLQGLRPILLDATAKDLVLLDELAVGTEPNTGSAIAQAILERLANKGCKVLVSTHYDNLKVIAVEDKRFRNGSMEFSMESLKPTYKLILDVPGQSYGLELAEQMGLPVEVIKRASELRGKTANALDEAVNQLMHAREGLQKEKQEMIARQFAADEQRDRFEKAKLEIENTKQKKTAQLGARYDEQLSSLREEFEETISDFKKMFKDLKKKSDVDDERQKYIDAKGMAEKKLQSFQDAIQGMQIDGTIQTEDPPGEKTTLEDITIGTEVFIIPLAENGIVTKIAREASDPVEVSAGSMKLRLPIEQVRVINSSPRTRASQKSLQKKQGAAKGVKKPKPPVIQTPTNTLDVRGYDSESAIDQSWDFIDKAILRGDRAIILLHGHGTDKLKNALRDALKNRCPYKVSFQPGDEKIGGDGVTIVYLD